MHSSEPPEEVLKAVFPFAETELEKLAKRRAEKRKSEDYALKQFLDARRLVRQFSSQHHNVLAGVLNRKS